MAGKVVGVTVMPEYLQSEGVQAVVDRLIERGVTAIATSPYGMELADERTGVREPPIDAGAGRVRVLDRPLWGHRQLWIRTVPSFAPDRKLYAGLRYQPPEAEDATFLAGRVVDDLIMRARARGLEVYLQVQAAIPPGYRVQCGGPQQDDLPRMPDGRVPRGRVDNNGTLASEHIVRYAFALTYDLLRRYVVDGIRFDWPEFPPYSLDSVFVDFSDHAQAVARRMGLDFEAMRHDAMLLYDRLHGSLTDGDLHQWIEYAENRRNGNGHDWPWADQYPAVAEWLQLKAALVGQMLEQLRTAVRGASGNRAKLSITAFPPPWSVLSGMHFGVVRHWVDEVAVKLYGMHWAMMVRSYADQLLQANPGLSRELLVRALVRGLDLLDGDDIPPLEQWHYPGPDEPHWMGDGAQRRKLQEAQAANGDGSVVALVHAYGPVEDFRRRLQTAWQASPNGVWINRYGYLSDEKLDVIGQTIRHRQFDESA